ncbi:raffinose/stachyose/melibiose transport system substrate-binding protein [Anaerocolumna jejuensis DSM 15929]|uniref:Raffinose/stachyose/melibiose transport system substrate-binding protein n=1 Tax=Anaerocolumna jejuensis DSM 15929 TaxID=1121322 RepID=A0A1M6RQZ1_9FIRM|nr:extracellular solute-binding protein [Anaerocolumna jejuensis]SHK34758.1 raffinose/stachyose/melibiose transport system substrate-binding protein [Anaerocolumna jejuensis DSM 15929]
MKKKLVTLVLSLCMVIGMFGGCSKSEPADSGTGNAAKTENGSSDAKNDSGTKGGEKEITVTIFHHIGEQTGRDNLDKMLALLEERNPGIKFEAQGIDYSQYDTILKTKLAGGDAPDIIMGRPKMYANLIDAGYIESLSGQPFLDQVSQESLASMTIDGNVYGVPTNMSGMGIFYNKEVFKKNGVEIPKTHEELLAASKKFQDAGIYPFAHGYKDSWPAQCEIQSDLYGYCLEKNPKMFEEIQSGEKQFADYPEFREVVQRTADRLGFESGDDFGTDSAQAREMLINGKAAMLVSGNWEIGEFINLGADDKVGFFATPNSDDSNPVLGLASDGSYMLCAQSEHKEAALKFIEFLATPEGAAMWNTGGKDIPCSLEVDSSTLSPIVQEIVDIEKNGKVYNYEAQGIFTGQFDSTFRKWQEEFAADTDRDVDKYIKKLDDEIKAIQVSGK